MDIFNYAISREDCNSDDWAYGYEKGFNDRLDKDDLITLVRGNSPGHDLMVKEPYNSCGNYNGSYGTWSWMNHKLKELSNDDLWYMHIQMKKQYK